MHTHQMEKKFRKVLPHYTPAMLTPTHYIFFVCNIVSEVSLKIAFLHAQSSLDKEVIAVVLIIEFFC